MTNIYCETNLQTQAYFGKRVNFDKAILDLNLQEAWGKMKRHPRE